MVHGVILVIVLQHQHAADQDEDHHEHQGEGGGDGQLLGGVDAADIAHGAGGGQVHEADQRHGDAPEDLDLGGGLGHGGVLGVDGQGGNGGGHGVAQGDDGQECREQEHHVKDGGNGHVLEEGEHGGLGAQLLHALIDAAAIGLIEDGGGTKDQASGSKFIKFYGKSR